VHHIKGKREQKKGGRERGLKADTARTLEPKKKQLESKDFSGDFQGDLRSLKASEEIIHQEFFITFSLLYFLNYHLIFCFNYGFLVFCNCVFDFEHG